MSSPENQDTIAPRESRRDAPDPSRQQSHQPENWQDAIFQLVASRIELVGIEAREAAKSGSTRAILVAASAVAALCAWILLVAASVGCLAAVTGWPWWAACFIAAGLHVIAIVIMIAIARKPGADVFTVTRAEFKKDREWIENLRKNQKSGN